MKKILLKIQVEQEKLCNVIKYKVDEKNSYVDKMKQAKKDKDLDEMAYLKKKKDMCEQDILNLQTRNIQIDKEIDILSHKMGKIRLDLTLFADILYNTLFEYKEFLQAHAVNVDGDNDTINAVDRAIDNIKLLPFEMAERDYDNELFNYISDRLLERWRNIRNGIVQESIRDADDQWLQNTKK